jgi:hypothetical protein
VMVVISVRVETAHARCQSMSGADDREGGAPNLFNRERLMTAVGGGRVAS